MSGLDRLVEARDRKQYGSRGRGFASQPPEDDGEGYRAGPELDRCPKKYDPEIWRLALAFMREAEKYDVELEVSIYRTYALLFRRIGKTKLRSRKNWIELVEKMIAEFWENDVDTSDQAWAINQFVGVETFRNLAKWAIRQGKPDVSADDWHSQDEYWAKIRQRGAERRAQRKADREAAIARMQTYEDPEAEREIRARARKFIDAAMKEFTE